MVVTYWTDVMFYEETVSTKWNHEKHDETMSNGRNDNPKIE